MIHFLDTLAGLLWAMAPTQDPRRSRLAWMAWEVAGKADRLKRRKETP